MAQRQRRAIPVDGNEIVVDASVPVTVGQALAAVGKEDASSVVIDAEIVRPEDYECRVVPPTGLITNQIPISKGEREEDVEGHEQPNAARSAVTAFRRLLLFLSKSDTAILDHCGNFARMTQESLGFAILFTGIFAFLGLSYAAYVVFDSAVIALVCGLLYASVVMWFDREVVSSFNRLQVWTRIPIAVLFGMIAAFPIELRLFEGRIEEELRRTDMEKNSAFYAEAVRIREGAAAPVELHDAQRVRLEADEKHLVERLKLIQRDTAEFDRKADDARQFMAGEEFGREGGGLSGIEGKGRNYKYHERILDVSEARLAALAGEREAAEDALRNVRQRSAELLHERDELVARVDAETQAELARARERLYRDGPTDLLARFEALLRLANSSPGAGRLAVLCWVFFVLIETAPAVAKVFVPKTEYHSIVEAECLKNSHRVVQISNEAILQIKQNPYDRGAVTLEDYLRENPVRWGAYSRESVG